MLRAAVAEAAAKPNPTHAVPGHDPRTLTEALPMLLRTMPRSALSAALVAASSLSAASCTDDQDPEGAASLYEQLQAADYRSWARAPGYSARRSSSAPHGNEVDIYVNDVVASALAAGEPLEAWPEGSLIVKDGWDGSDLELIAAMEKRSDGWYWAEWDGEGSSLYSGKPAVCADCHASGDDYVRAFGLP
jgi:hypothetical protein